ncbi:MAG: hypothetical protein AAFX65_07910 [Cyanobacteria bacterium J06638_7]
MEIPINSDPGEGLPQEDSAPHIQGILSRTLALIDDEREQWRAFEINIDHLLRQCIERLGVLIALIRNDVAGKQPDLPEPSRDLVLQDTVGAEQLLAQVEQRLAQPQIAGKGRAVSFDYLRNALALLEAGLTNSGAGSTGPNGLQDRINREVAVLSTIESDLRQRPEILEALHMQASFVHRCRTLLGGKPQTILPDLHSLALQIEEAAKGERVGSAGDASYWIARNAGIEEKLCDLEARQRSRWPLVPSLGWLSRKLARWQRQESSQGRILAGLGVSLSIALGFYALATSATFLLGTLAAINKTNARLRNAEAYSVMASQVRKLLDNNNQRLDIEADLELLNTSIDDSVQSIKDLQAGPDSAAEDGVPDPQILVMLKQAELDLLNDRRADKQRELALKVDHQTQLLSGLSRLETQLSTRPATEAQAAMPLAGNTVVLNGSGLSDIWYVSVVDVLASPVQDPAFLRHSRRLVLAAFAGALGSIMSILIRLDQMDGKKVKSPFLVGALKPVIGAVFGIVTFMILSTNVIDFMPANFRLHGRPAAVPGASGDPATELLASRDPLGELDSQELYKIFLVAFLAGFSERLASDTLRSVDRK